jgi:hypothetical protein
MAYQPDPPFPKARGNAIRSEDWNEAVTEVARLEQAKLDRAGGTLSGNLTVTGNLSGRITGTLADGTVGTNQLVNGSVTADKLAGGSVTNPKLSAGAVSTDKIQAGAVYPEKLVGTFFLRNASFTLGNGVGTTLEVVLTQDSVPDGPTPFVFPMMFVSSTTPGAGFSWTHLYTRLLDFDTFQYVGSHRVRFVQVNGGAAEIRLTAFAFRWF